MNTITGKKLGHDYSKLDKYGLVKEGTEITDETIIIGMTSNVPGSDILMDHSETTKKGQLGIVHKTFITDGEEGTRIAKVKIREERIPAIGDKMASRSGQKGTIGMIIPEQDMPFTKNGLRPDIIINPHALPTRMTIGQLVECIVGKACLDQGFHGDCTAFNSNGNQLADFQKMLTKSGMHSSGNDILYNGMNGDQIESEIFMGPTYYMRLKHMVKDKVNFRARGPMTQLTRQPVSGRANDGGLRIGEMERDSIISHGATEFLKESMLVRGDQYYMAVCNKTGGIAIYNPDQNVFMSPLADGPLKFVDSLDGISTNVEHVTKFGRSFSVVRVPYVFKLFMQELQAINVKMAIITEDNVDQFDNMNFSRNISLLTTGKGLEEIKEMISNELSQEKPKKEVYDELSSSEERFVKKPSEPEGYEPEGYVPKSPEGYVPKSPEGYVPMSPVGSPNGSQVGSQNGSRIGSQVGSPIGSVPISQVGSPAESPPSPPSPLPISFQVNEFVTFNGDFKPNRAWKITEFDKGFAVLETDDKEGLSSNLKVAALSDIKRFSQQQQPPSPDAMGLAPTQAPPPITVNVISGDNNTMETPKQKPTEDVDFSEPRIRFKEPSETSETKSDISDFSNPKSIVVKKV